MTDSELYAHYKRTAPAEDLKFMLAHARLSDELRRDAEATLDQPSHASNARLRQRWRQERNLADLADRLLASYAVPPACGYLPAAIDVLDEVTVDKVDGWMSAEEAYT